MKKEMMKERMDLLKKAGISVNDMLQFIMENERVDVKLVDGGIVLKEVEIDIVDRIKADGYLKNPKLWRRWIMAQMFRMENYKRGWKQGYTAYLEEQLPFDYQIRFLIDEVDRIIHIQNDGVALEYIRECKVSTIKKIVMEVYKMTAEEYKDKASKDAYYADLVTRLRFAAEDVQTAYGYEQLLALLKAFYKRMLKMPDGCKSPAFKDLYKGIGGYWTAKNLIMYHDCTLPGCDKYETMLRLEAKARDFFSGDGEGWKMLGFMRELIEKNKFDYHKRMVELGVHKDYRYTF